MKRFLALLLSLLTLFALAACGAPENSAAHVSLTLCNTLPDDERAQDAMEAFAEAVWEATEETVDVTVSADADEAAALDAVRAGTLDMTVVSFDTMCALCPQWKALAMPYLFLGRSDYWAAMESDAVRALFDLTAAEGFVGLTWLDAGSRCLYTASKKITAPEDLQGLRIGSTEPDLVRDMLSALGAECVPMEYDAIPAALADGTIDGAEDNVLAMFDHGAQVGYLMYDDHVRTPRVIVVSTAALARLDEAQQAVLRGKAYELCEYYKAARVAYEDEARAEAKLEYGAELVSKFEHAPFREACAPVYDALKESGSPAAALVDEILAMEPPASK